MYAGNLTLPPSRPIEDAPTDGTFILGWSARWAGPALIHWATRHYFDDRDPVSGWMAHKPVFADSWDFVLSPPTHWWPLEGLP